MQQNFFERISIIGESNFPLPIIYSTKNLKELKPKIYFCVVSSCINILSDRTKKKRDEKDQEAEIRERNL